ncbi:hypothetical protein, partial [Pseudomonas syringae]|uniref:hypothetical protein n=1 Tax=Pseudomonas syringae TaxID=317 RepID=UPI000A533A9D
HQTPLCGEHSRLNGCPVSLDHYRGNVRFGTDSFRSLEAAWDYELKELLSALDEMRSQGLVEFIEGRYTSTKSGRIARERRWQEKRLRHPSLTSSSATIKDVLIALTRSGGYEAEGQYKNSLNVETIDIFLPDTDPIDIETAILELIDEGIIRRGRHVISDDIIVIALSPEGVRHYAHRVVARLGIKPPATILSPAEPERFLFDNLGLPPDLTDNLRYRWEEAERCETARAWLAANILYGSILEATLHGWLGRMKKQALAARAAPKKTIKGGKNVDIPIPRWGLNDLISVALELGLIDPTLTRHAHALRDNRNLVHPARQIEERSEPDSKLTAISKQVVGAVLSAMASKP